MGTNYYLRYNPCKCCGLAKPDKHIGKSSWGWYFLLHVIPLENINSLEDWKKVWSDPESKIFDEYDYQVDPDEMTKIITERSNLNPNQWSAEELERNCAITANFGLVRSQIGRNCVGHGPGTWDYIEGDFS
jgi:hypothetical protein